GLPVLAAILLIAFAVWAHQFTKVGPNEVLIISGRKKGDHGYRIVRGGGTYVRPFREKVQRLSLELMQFDVRSAETYTMHGVPVQVDGVCMVKIDSSDEGISRASEQFLSRGREDIVRTAMQAVEGHMRAAIGALSIEDIYRERQRLVAAVRTLAGPDLSNMGLQTVSLTIRNVADKQGYLEALGRPRTAQVKRDAIRGEAEAEREAKAARFEADLAIEDSRRAYETERARYKAEGLRALAAAVSAPRAQTEKIVMIGGNGSSAGASRITKDVTQIMAEMPEVLEALTGLKLEDLAKRIPGVKGSGDNGGDVDGDAE